MKQIKFLATEEEHKLYKILAAMRGITMNDLFRSVLANEIEDSGIVALEIELVEADTEKA